MFQQTNTKLDKNWICITYRNELEIILSNFESTIIAWPKLSNKNLKTCHCKAHNTIIMFNMLEFIYFCLFTFNFLTFSVRLILMNTTLWL